VEYQQNKRKEKYYGTILRALVVVTHVPLIGDNIKTSFKS
jgi:hypothetical protein